jgi:trigger factor
MKTEIVDVSPTKKEIKIEIAPEDVRAEFDRVSQQYARMATVPGFRKGHAPVGVIRTRYKKEIRGDVMQKVVPEALSRAIEENSLVVIGQPELHFDKERADKLGQEPVSLHAHVEVMPDVDLGEYKGLEAARRLRPVTEETIDRMIEDLRESSASLQPVEDRGAELGDTVTVYFNGRYLEPPSDEEIKVEDVDVVLGGQGVLDAFTENLTGTRPDDTRTFTISYPADFSSQGLAGKTIEYAATINAVRRKELPEPDDEWAKSLGEEAVDSMEKLREHLRQNMTKSYEIESQHRLRDEIMERLVAAHEFEVPESLVSYQSQQILQDTIRDMIRRRIDPRDPELNWDDLRARVGERADTELRRSMLLERVADEEKIEVSDEEVEDELKSLSEASGQSIEQVRAALTKQGGERSIAHGLRNRKALDFLVAHANIRDEEWRDEEEEKAASPDDEPSSDRD